MNIYHNYTLTVVSNKIYNTI